MEYYFSADWHLGHKNILKYDNRPFDNIEEHDEVIIKNYNEIVKKGDNFYFLGDFSFVNKERTEQYLKRLNGNLFFIKGNHDSRDTIKLYQKYGTYLGELKKISAFNTPIILCHYKMLVWDLSHHGAWHLYGHSHGSLEHFKNGRSFDVGTMLFDYKPISFEQVDQIMETREFTPIDHHK